MIDHWSPNRSDQQQEAVAEADYLSQWLLEYCLKPAEGFYLAMDRLQERLQWGYLVKGFLAKDCSALEL